MTARKELQAIQQRADAATPGPWMQDPDDPAIVLKPDKPGGWDGTIVASVQRDDYGLVEEGTTEFIAAARTDVPRLVAALTAVLDVHRRNPLAGDEFCVACFEDWPCKSVQVIDTALNPKEEASGG